MKQIKGFIDKTSNLAETISCVILFFCTFSAFAGTLMRHVITKPFSWIEEVSALCLVWIVFLILPKLDHEYNHLRMSVFVNSFGPRWQKFLKVLQSIVVIFIGCYLFYHAWGHVKLNLDLGVVTPGLELPVWMAYLILPLSFAFLVFVHLVKIVLNDYSAPSEQTGKEV